MTRFGSWLATQRTERTWSQADLARFIAVAPAQISRWESGAQLPYLQQFALLMRVLCVRDVHAVLRLLPPAADDDVAAA